MSDSSAHKKGMRTFASDFARAKETRPPEPTANVAKKQSTTKHTNTDVTAKKETANKIPAFHELQKAVTKIDLSDKEPAPKPPTTKGITPTKQVTGGAIITDTKKSDFSLFSASKDSITAWFKSKKKKPTPKLGVPDAGLRRGVIQQATTKSGTIFTADNETLRERIKERNRLAESKKAEPETTWTPFTETGVDLLPAGHVPPVVSANKVVVGFKKQTVPGETKTEPPKPIPVVAPVVAATPKVTPEPKQKAEPKPVTISETKPEPRAVDQKVATPQVTPDQQPVTPVPPEPKEFDAKMTYEPIVEPITTNQLTMYVSAGVALVVVTGFFVWFVFANQSSTTDQLPPIAAITDISVVTPIVVSEQFNASDISTFTGGNQYTELVLQNSVGEMLPTALVFSLVTPNIPRAVQQFATDVRFIQSGDDRPQMVITIADPTSITGALLMNETSLASSLAPLYGQSAAGTFTDQSIVAVDVRVLSQAEVGGLTYGIINDQQLIIADSPESFIQIASLLKN